MLILIIAGGPDKGRIYELNDGGPIVLGREGDQVKLNDRKVSREHARLWSEGGQWYLEDLGSRHGTYRNHTALDPGQRAKLKDGDYLQIGTTVMVLGRMPAEHAEKLALLAEQAAGQPSALRRPALIGGVVAVAALLGLGVYVAIELNAMRGAMVPQDRFAELERQLLDAQRDQADRIEQTMDRQNGVNRQILTHQQQLATTIGESTQAIQRHSEKVADATDALQHATGPILDQLAGVSDTAQRQQLAIERLGEMLAHQQASDNSAKLMAAMEDIKAVLGDQPSGLLLTARLEQAIRMNAEATGRAVRQAMAEHERQSPGTALASAGDTEALLKRVLEALDRVPTREQLALEVRQAMAEATAENEQYMRLVLAELRRTGDQITTDVVAAVGEDAGQAQRLMEQVVAELGQQPTGAQLAADLKAAMDGALAGKTDTDAELPALMRRVLDELEQRPTSEQLAGDLRRLIGEDAQRTEVLVNRVLTELDQRPTARQIAMELRAVDNESAAQTAALLESVLEKVNTQDQLAAQIASLREQIESLPGRNDQAVREVLARLDEQDRNNTAMIASIAELRAAVPDDLPGRLDEVIAQLDEQVRTEQITDAIEQSMQRIAAAQDTQTRDALTALSDRLDALPSAEEIAAVADSQQALAELLNRSDAREVIGQLRASLEQLADRMPEADDEKLTRIIAMLEQREKAELLLAELHDAVGKQSDQTESLKQELLEALAAARQPDSEDLLRELLTQVEDKLVTHASVRQAIRDEMRGTVLPNQMALADAHDVTTASGGIDHDDPQTQALPRERLTRLESAYKRSFETGQPMTVGAGVVDPSTGQVSEGRLIDPEVAKALGFETWRDWYLTDRHAEQMRLQQQSLLQRNANDARDTGTIELPPVEPEPDNTRPEQD